MQILQNLLYLLIFPGFLWAVLAGLLLNGIDRKLTARMQRRIGPPVTQPLWDVLKLFGKECIVPAAAAKRVFLAAPVVGFAAISVCAVLIPVFGHTPFAVADAVAVLYLLTLASVAIMAGGMASGSPYAGVGVSRAMVTMMSYELPLVLILLAVCRLAGSFSLSEIAAYQTQNGLNLLDWRLIPAAFAMLLIVPCEVGAPPFDAAEAGIEICEGPLCEYSGWALALFKLMHAVKTYTMAALFCVLFLGGTVSGYLIPDTLVLLISALAVTVLSMTLANTVCARFKVERLFRFFWGPVTLLAAVSLLFVWIF